MWERTFDLLAPGKQPDMDSSIDCGAGFPDNSEGITVQIVFPQGVGWRKSANFSDRFPDVNADGDIDLGPSVCTAAAAPSMHHSGRYHSTAAHQISTVAMLRSDHIPECSLGVMTHSCALSHRAFRSTLNIQALSSRRPKLTFCG